MNAVRSIAFLAALTVSPIAFAPAQAMTVANVASLAESAATAPAAFDFADVMMPGRSSRLDRVDVVAASEAAESYFDFDAIITFGALALAGGLFAALGVASARKAKGENTDVREPAWRDAVLRALQADLADFTQSYRRAA